MEKKIECLQLHDIVKHKTNIRGYWLDNGKVYKDNIEVKEIYSYNNLNVSIKKLFVIKKQLAVFYKRFNKAYIEYNDNSIDELKTCIVINVKKLSAKHIQNLLFKHNGLTIFKNKYDYTIEIWSQ